MTSRCMQADACKQMHASRCMQARRVQGASNVKVYARNNDSWQVFNLSDLRRSKLPHSLYGRQRNRILQHHRFSWYLSTYGT
jgi:hypothetical protein